MLRGWASGESGNPKASTQLAPKEAISQGVPDIRLSQPVTAMATTVPTKETRVKCSEGAGGAPDLSSEGRGMAVVPVRDEVAEGYRSVYLKVNRSVYTGGQSFRRLAP
ncbi:hypothetical protein D3C80_650350 [compost metagenome]